MLCEYRDGFYNLLLGEPDENWRRKVLGKMLECIKKSSTVDDVKCNKEDLRDHVVYKEIIPIGDVDTDVGRILLILANFIQNKADKRRVGEFSVQEEFYQVNNLTKEIFTFLTMNGSKTLGSIALLFLISVLLSMSADIWVGFWNTNYLNFSNKNYYLYMYAVVAIAASVFVIYRDVSFRLR